jgi:hypothetical protein
MRIFKTRWFARFARQEGLPDNSLLEAIQRAERGLVDADLGGGLIKQRLARQGQGRSGGYRAIVAYRAKGRAVFLFGFAKNELENIGSGELLSLRSNAAYWLNLTPANLHRSLKDRALEEVDDGKEE